MKTKLPQRKRNKDLTPEELMQKAFTGTHITLTDSEKREIEAKMILENDKTH